MRIQTIKLLALAAIVALLCLVQHYAAFNVPAAERQATSTGESAPPTDLIDDLDRAVQKRFHSVVGFGMARIATEKKFSPETEEEKSVIDSLKKSELKVGLYLAGRLVLEPKPSDAQWGEFGLARAISAPIFVGSKTTSTELPKRLELWEQTQKAMAAFEQGKDLYEFTVGGWSVRARPVRASDQSCLKCHNTEYRLVYLPNGGGGYEKKGDANLRVGDPLGALLYAYSQAR